MLAANICIIPRNNGNILKHCTRLNHNKIDMNHEMDNNDQQFVFQIPGLNT